MKKMAITLLSAVQHRQWRDDDGAVSAEYGVLLAGIVADGGELAGLAPS